MICLVFFFISLGLAMSVPLHNRDSTQEEDAIKDYPDVASVHEERDPALKFPLALPRAKDSQEHDAVERENWMTGERRGKKRGYGYKGYGYKGYGYKGYGYGGYGKGKKKGGYGGYRGGYGGYGYGKRSQ